MRNKKALSLIEIIIAVVILSLILVWVVNMLRDIAMEKSIALEKSKVDQIINVFEKNLKNYINNSDLNLNMNLLDIINSNLNDIRPFYVSSAVIVPAIYQTQSDYLLIYYNNTVLINNNNQRISYINVRLTQNNTILFSGIQSNQRNLIFRVLTNNNQTRFFWYYMVQNPFLNQQTISTIDFGTPAMGRRFTYQISMRFRRIPVIQQNGRIDPTVQEIIYQTHGNITNINQVQGIATITNPNIIYSEITVAVLQQANQANRRRRVFFTTRAFNIYVRHKSII
ncbi:MAG: prepilin-type N-terminal cleavage/methylation domain-containing protein [bacterium]